MCIADQVLPFCFEKEDLQMGFTKRELIEFLDGLVELASEENKVKAVLAKEKFISDFENEDEPVVGELTVEKKGEILDGYKGGLFADSDEKEFIYKEGSLEGAEFEVYAAEDIFTADMQKDENGNRTKYYSKGDLVATLTTGEDGKAGISGLPLGQYRVVETKAPYGYVLNGEEQPVTFVYVDDKTPIIHESVTFTNDRQKLDMSVIKKDAEEDTPVAGAVFGLYAAEDIENASGEIIIEAGTLLETAVSDENGRITFKKDYPFAVYEAKELEAPKGYVSSEEVITFETEYQGQHEAAAEYSSEFLNEPTTFEFTKEDIASGAELSGAMLTVIDKDGNVVDRWTSVADEAHVIKRLAAGETYTLREEFAPYGYLKAEEIKFTVEDTADVQSVVMKDEVPTGAIIINKDGEFVTDTTLMKGHWYDFIFNYFKDSLAGVEFEVYAAEDIVSPDGLDTVYYEADELVAAITTDEKGYANIDSLPLGKYYLVETKTLEGFVLDDTPIEADLSYIDQDTRVVYAGMNISNERQKVQITVVKKEAGTKEVLEGAVFGLFAKEDIVNKDGKVVVKAGTEIERGVTGKDGKLTFVSDLPLGKYYVQELTAPKGYVKSDKVFEVDASYQGDDKEVIEFEAEFENKPIKVQISKTDITGSNELEGAVLSIIDADGRLVEKWTSGKEPHMIEKLPAGKYILREETAPFGYVIAQDIEFEVKETAEIQKVAMKDEAAVGKIIISKKSEDGKALAGAKFEIRDKDGKVIETLTTDKDGHAESGELPIAAFKDGKYEAAVTYTVVEVEAPEGYLLDSTPKEVKFEYKDGKTKVIEYTLEVTNKPTEPKLPQTGDSMNPWAWADRTGKVNETMDALHLVPPDCLPDKLYPTVYLNHVYEEYKKSGDLQGTLELAAFYLAGACREAERKNGRIILQDAPESIVMSLINTEQNREMLGYMPHREFEDLSVIYRYVIDTGNPVESVPVTVEMAEGIGMGEKELFDAAVENTRRLFPPTVELLNDIIVEMFMDGGFSEEAAREMGSVIQTPMYCISNKMSINGAVSMLYGDVIHGVSEQLGSDLYILPLSVHEVMAVQTEGAAAKELAELVEKNNMSKIRLGDRLSNQVYRYDKEQRILSLATDTPNKRLDGRGTGQDRTDGKKQSR